MKIPKLIILTLFTFIPLICSANSKKSKVYSIDANLVTGLNRFASKPLFKFPEAPPPAQLIGFDALGEYDPNGTDPIPLSMSTPDNAILATYLDSFFLQPQFSPVEPELLNIPIRDVATWTISDLMTREIVPPHLESDVLDITQAEPDGELPITFGQWQEASGKLTIKENQDGARIKIRVNNLIPRRLYTVWALWFVMPDDAPPFLFPQPLGGLPNAYVTSSKGNAVFRRQLNFNPIEEAQTEGDGKVLIAIATHLHSDHIAYGGVPSPIQGGMPPGTVLHGQLEWNLGNGEPFDPNNP